MAFTADFGLDLAQVRGVNHRYVDPFVKNGFLDKDEESIKRAFANIIGESYVPKDWAGENQDLYTSRIFTYWSTGPSLNYFQWTWKSGWQ
jgi:hypothetical protein